MQSTDNVTLSLGRLKYTLGMEIIMQTTTEAARSKLRKIYPQSVSSQQT